ncbi:MAG: DUF4982 domain-containing protein, partial [Suipraeoptans sp.]
HFHEKYPNIPIGLSEYGCEALDWHSSHPEQGDYTEEYQAYYHEELIKQLFTRPYIWATHVWNMFDFAADARDEGGESGINHKGLVTFDRKYKKDAFYAYKAWLSDDPFVHICGKRYVNRAEELTKIAVYTNLEEVELFANGSSLGKQKGTKHFFYYEVPNVDETEIVARSGEYEDHSLLRKVEKFDENYRMKEAGNVLNWFEITTPKGYFSINDKLGDIMGNSEGMVLIGGILKSLMSNTQTESGFDLLESGDDVKQMIAGFTVKRLFSMLGTMGAKKNLTKEEMLDINQSLNQIKKEIKEC